MSTAYDTRDNLAPDDFADCRHTFLTMLDNLGSLEPTDEATLSERIDDATREVARLALEATLARMARYEPIEPPQAADGVERTRSRTRARSMTSLFGEVRLERRGAAAPGVESLFLADAWLNLGHGQLARYSFALCKRVAHCVAEGSFRSSEAMLARFGCPSIGRRQLEQIAIASACDFNAFYKAGAHSADDETEPEETSRELLVLSFDAKGVPMIPSGLRDATFERAMSAPIRERGDPVEPGHKPDRKRMAQVATIYSVSPNPRRVSDILNGGYQRPKPSGKRIFGSLEEDPIVTMRRAFTEAQRRDPEHEREWVVLVDGCPHQLRRVNTLLEEFRVEAPIVLDLIHVQEKLWAAARALWSDKTKRKRWVSNRLERLLRGKSPSGLARGMRQSATKRGLSKRRRKPVDKCARYLRNASDYLRYATVLSKGWPIATGVIEGTCRHLVGERLVIGGAKWSLPGAEAILRLRALLRNDDFEQYWEFHERREWERNHASRYADGHVPRPKPVSPDDDCHLRLVE